MNQKSKRVRPSIWGIVILTIFALALSACAPASTPPPPTAIPPTMAAPTLAPVVEPVVRAVQDAKLGQILVDEKGMTLYAFTKDEPGKSNCAGDCLKAWPPLHTAGMPQAGEGVDASLLGATSLPDGTQIVTYNQMPLYYWVADVKPGDTTGQNVNEVWFVVTPQGEMVTTGSVPNTGASANATLSVADDPTLGKILVDGNGMTLYMFAKDKPNQSNCAGDCLKAWPPFLSDAPVVGDGVDASLLSTTAMSDGKHIVTYNGMPLYYFVKDTKPGDVLGQNVNEVWFVVAPDGKVVQPVSTSARATEPVDEYGNDNSKSSSDDVKLMLATSPSLGQFLVDANGMTLYMFAKDTRDTSNCAGDCLKAWPPFLAATGQPRAEDGVDESLIGTAPLADGSQIVTYNGMPLYYFVKDTKPGDVLGQNVNEVWFVVSPQGQPIK